MRSRRQKWTILIACGILAIALTWSLFHEREPSYKDHTLSEWAHAYSYGDDGRYAPKFNPTKEETRAALLTIGTNNLSLLVRYIANDPETSIAAKLLYYVPFKITPEPVRQTLLHTLNSKIRRGYASSEAFKILGPLGAPAVPGLTKIVNSGPDFPADNAILALSYIGESALPILIATANDTKHPKRLEALVTLNAYTNSPTAIAALKEARNDPDPDVRDAADNVPGRSQKR